MLEGITRVLAPGGIMNWLKQLLSRRRQYRELSEEIQAHLEEKVEELVAEGMSREEAIQFARREFGNLRLIEEDSREVWRWPPVEDFFLDIRYGLRALRHNPVFTTVALLTIAIGIAANGAVFSVVNSVLLKPLNYPQAEELVALHQVAPGAEGLADFENGLPLSPSMYFTYSDQNRTFQSLGVWVTGTANVTGLAEPEQVRTVAMTDGVFEALGVPPAVGRWFSQVDQVPNGPERAMLSYGYWQRQFGGDPAVQFAGRWTGGDGAGALDERRSDDSHICSVAKGRSGVRGPAALADNANLHPGLADR